MVDFLLSMRIVEDNRLDMDGIRSESNGFENLVTHLGF